MWVCEYQRRCGYGGGSSRGGVVMGVGVAEEVWLWEWE